MFCYLQTMYVSTGICTFQPSTQERQNSKAGTKAGAKQGRAKQAKQGRFSTYYTN